MATRAAPSPRAPLWPRLLAIVPAVALVLLGIWVAGGVVTDDFRLSMGLTTLWFALVAGGAVVAWRRVPLLRPAAVAAVVAFAVVGGVLAVGTFRDVTVDETVATGAPSLSGTFVAGAHETTGTARLVSVGSARVVTLTNFRTSAGPDLFVYAVPSGATDNVTGGVRLGRLKGNIGNQQYELLPGLDFGPGTSIVIWCRSFTVAFGSAPLAAS